MSELMEQAKAHFKSRMQGELKWVDVEEWGNGSPQRVYFRPSLTLKDQGEILALSNEGKQAEALALTLILRSLDEEGKRLFVRANQTELLRSVDPDVIVRIINAMNDDDLTDEDLLGN